MADRRDRPEQDDPAADDRRPRRERLALLTLAAAGMLVAALAFLLAPDTASASGRVTAGGVPVAAGTVTMAAPDGTRVSAGIRPDGTYALAGLPPGPVCIGVVVMPEVALPANPGVMGRGRRPIPPNVRPTYTHADPATSGLTADLGRGRNTHHIDLR